MRCQHCDCQSARQASQVTLRDYFWLAEYLTRPEISGKPRWLGVLILAAYVAIGPVMLIVPMLWLGAN